MEERQLDLSRFRMEKARDDLEVSKLTLDNKKFSQSINRSYYSMFHAARALLALDEFDSKRHSGVISYFAENYVKTGKIEPEYSKMLTGAFRIRNFCDYSDFFVVAYADAKTQFDNAVRFIKRVEEYIKTILSKSD